MKHLMLFKVIKIHTLIVFILLLIPFVLKKTKMEAEAGAEAGGEESENQEKFKE